MASQAPHAFRIDVGTVGELSAFVDAFRLDALRVLDRRYHRAVADETVRLVDENRLGVSARSGGKGPLRDAVAEVRRVFEESYQDPVASVDFDCEIAFFLVGDAVLARFDFGNGDYLKLFSTRAGVRPYGWSTGARPEAVPAKEWKERAALWSKVDGSGLGAGLGFHLVDGPLPAPNWQAIQKVAPDHESRVRRCARSLAWFEKSGTPAPASAKEGRDFKDWLKSSAGVLAYDRARRRVEGAIPREVGRDDMAAYQRVAKASRAERPPVAEPPRAIDHADIYEGADGAVFVVVWDAGLKRGERLYIQVSGGSISFVQAGIHFGSVDRVPHAATDLLRSTVDATVVEVAKLGDRREVKAKHAAIVRSTTIGDGLGEAMTRWKTTAASGAAKESAWTDK